LKRTRRRALATFVICCSLAFVAGATAEVAWVKGAPLNLRSGAGTEFRILATTTPGERVEVLERTERWVKVKKAEGTAGWIAAGYLEPKAPPLQRVGILEAELEELSGQLDEVTTAAEKLRSESDTLRERDEGRAAELSRLEQQNVEYRAGARWPEWVTGALILSTGMALGAVLRQLSGRRQNRLRF
jgi:hypothetical protein